GCSPQGQCGCCTVLVDGQPRVACVTPVRRIAGRSITTFDGLPAADRDRWGEAFATCGATQCGFCTPGIVVRLAALEAKGIPPGEHGPVEQALLAHLCRCTGWRTIVEAWDRATGPVRSGPVPPRDADRATRRARLEGGVDQAIGPEVAAGRGGFADDLAPAEALVAVPDGRGGYAVGATLTEARAAAGRVPGRHTTDELRPVLAVPEGDWDITLQTGWVEPAYLEPDASWCWPGGTPATPLGNGGAFGGKHTSKVQADARRLADQHGRAVRVLWSREDVVRLGPKRPPLAAGVDRRNRRVVARVVRTPGVADALAAALGPDAELAVEEVDVAGPPTSRTLRAAGWAEGVALRAALDGVAGEVASPQGGRARAVIGPDGSLDVHVDAGMPLDEAVLRSYCMGAAHMAAGWVTSEGIVVDDDGVPVDLTIRSFGVLRAIDTPFVRVVIEPSERDPVNGSDAVFGAVAAAVWAAQGFPPRWPTGRTLR
ncbi:MAG: xanthine dehydrogenase small subunit, partial [Acidimicrobiia bacterium]|nr:xanthine dehydrogenase small subunit [Acidimicrobiia bacterium]